MVLIEWVVNNVEPLGVRNIVTTIEREVVLAGG
jgi:hypothetical protein